MYLFISIDILEVFSNVCLPRPPRQVLNTATAPFTWSKSANSSRDTCINEILLRDIFGVTEKLDERQDSMCAFFLQSSCQSFFVAVVHHTPCDSWIKCTGGSLEKGAI